MNDPIDQPSRPQTKATKRPKGAVLAREERLKVALKANMARRKAQAKARMGDQDEKSQGQ